MYLSYFSKKGDPKLPWDVPKYEKTFVCGYSWEQVRDLAIRAHLEEGWEPVGNVFTSVSGEYLQIIIREVQ